jgi:hypothetical protein
MILKYSISPSRDSAAARTIVDRATRIADSNLRANSNGHTTSTRAVITIKRTGTHRRLRKGFLIPGTSIIGLVIRIEVK